ncbi:hypothetical protein [Catenuloplanes japonicus]|uniref:hypothetical protein n=1 Tax=Catenuloplanes japonicus TaxID=33876 RepID=UPI000AC7073A|nr:hypothetical protein [Catenuloplanes japonicus]
MADHVVHLAGDPGSLGGDSLVNMIAWFQGHPAAYERAIGATITGFRRAYPA